MKRNNGGFTLIEVLVAIVVLGLIVVPMCSSLVMSARINAKAESILEAKLAVSSKVEELMASGIDGTKLNAGDYDSSSVKVEGSVTNDAEGNPLYYTITVISLDVDTVSVETQIRAGGGS